MKFSKPHENSHRSEAIQATHTREEQYKCEWCGSAFSLGSFLTSHNRIHTEEKLYKYEPCDVSFSHRSHLPFQLEFTPQCNLQSHIRIHTGEKPYNCDTCVAAFAGRFICRTTLEFTSELIHTSRRIRVHTGEKPYKCLKYGAACSEIFHMHITRGLTPEISHKRGIYFIERVLIGEKPYMAVIYRNTREYTLENSRSHARFVTLLFYRKSLERDRISAGRIVLISLGDLI
ncbi:ZN235-like protein [Mya arenaria]|uniref:ZN235-like protein n=1 Tax=Mya arenaria TaxID=6604 RepID=A0ABY7EGP5_MYAAR|nr:ZN235-like protein [Mya arenaria]